MAGGYYSKRQRDRAQTLAERTEPSGESPGDPLEPRPCWLAANAAAIPGPVLAWRHTGEGGWRALVVVDVDAEQVEARESPVPPRS